MSGDLFGFVLALGLLGVLAAVVQHLRLPRHLKLILYAGLVLRVVGTFGRYYMVAVLYGGTGDSYMYFEWGQRYAELVWQLDFDSGEWSAGGVGRRWWGTHFVRQLTGLVLALIGPSFLGAYLVYSTLAFIGLCGFAVAFFRAYPAAHSNRFAMLLFLFPSLWFWPSAIGKEAIIFLGLGLATAGFVGGRGRINWPLMALGLFFIFAVRVQVAAVFLFTIILAHWFSLSKGRWTGTRIAQGLALLVVGFAGIWLAMRNLGVESVDVGGVQGWMEDNTGRGDYGGSGIEGAAVSLSGIPMAVVNILFRPFLWEARNPMVLVTSLEIGAFWAMAWIRRRSLAQSFRAIPTDRLLQMALIFVLVYAASLGMLIANLGIIARQRVFLFPFLFILLEAAPRAVRAPVIRRSTRALRQRVPRHARMPRMRA